LSQALEHSSGDRVGEGGRESRSICCIMGWGRVEGLKCKATRLLPMKRRLCKDDECNEEHVERHAGWEAGEWGLSEGDTGPCPRLGRAPSGRGTACTRLDRFMALRARGLLRT
jgi:hypothetical protein